jgi:hypothetical protein
MILALRFEATDGKLPTAQLGTANELNFRIVTREELMQDLQRRQLEQRRELENVLEAEFEARARLGELPGLAGDTEAARRARTRIETVARRQLALAAQVQGIGQRYTQIVAELANNRLFEPTVTRGLQSRVVQPLEALGRRGIPTLAGRVSAFAAAGTESARVDCIETCDQVIAQIEALLAQMERGESLAALIDALRGIIRTEAEVEAQVRRLLDAEIPGLFDPVDAASDPEAGENR